MLNVLNNEEVEERLSALPQNPDEWWRDWQLRLFYLSECQWVAQSPTLVQANNQGLFVLWGYSSLQFAVLSGEILNVEVIFESSII